jgi:hypothetical protein
MIALSILQPYAWLIVNGHKDIENRSWPTGRRAPFLVHAGKRYSRADHVKAGMGLDLAYGIVLPAFEAMPLGGIVGLAEITDCVRDHASPWKMPDSWGFVLRHGKPLPFTPWRGQLGWFDVPLDQLRLHEAEPGLSWSVFGALNG